MIENNETNSKNTDEQAVQQGTQTWTNEQVKQILQQKSRKKLQQKSRKKRGGCASSITFLLLLILGATLPFHYVFSHGSLAAVFPKSNLTFSNTIITQEDIDNLVRRYNNAGLLEQAAMEQDPLIKKLKENDFIRDAKKNTDSQNTDN